MSDVVRRFPQGFFWGTATSAHQVEGDNSGSDWWRFERVQGAIADGSVSGAACRHYERFDSDFALAQADGHNAHRLSLEWSRIEPEPGRFDEAQVGHYRDVFASLRRRGLIPIVTLHHFTNPLWAAERGGWENPEILNWFERYVRFCARAFGADVDWWVTINEPEVMAFRGWSQGAWPPAKRDDGLALNVLANLLEGHARAYRALHEEDRTDADGDGHPVRAGYAKHHPQLEPDRPWYPPDVLRAHFENQVFNHAVVRAPLDGEIRLELPGARPVRRIVPGLKGSLDFFGLNYYTRWMVRMHAPEPHVARPGAPVTDLGWEIYPRGLEQTLVRLRSVGLPILITENGFADASDRFRPRALVETLLHLGRALDRGVQVIGYLHWSLMDNFEWADGYRARFGLYAVDFEDPDLPRRRRHSAELFARIARSNALEREVLSEVGL